MFVPVTLAGLFVLVHTYGGFARWVPAGRLRKAAS
jgi:hypothetical protein